MLDEGSPPGEGFLASLSREWESAALEAEKLGVEVSLLRFGIVLGKDGGALQQMVPIFTRFLGAPLGSGKQWFSWIHEEDLAAVYLHLLKPGGLTGPVNCTSPGPVRNEELTTALGAALQRPVLLPRVPAFVLKAVLGEFSSTLVEGQRVAPKRLLESGFRFRFPEISGALGNLLGPRPK